MPWHQKIPYLMNQSIGVSFVDGTGTSGCYAEHIMESYWLWNTCTMRNLR